MNKNLLINRAEILEKFLRFHKSLNRMKRNGEFKKLAVSRRRMLIKRLSKFRRKAMQLIQLRPQLATVAVLAALGFSTNVQAQFLERTGAQNPLDAVTGYLWSTLEFVDLDNDGDYDAVFAEYAYGTGSVHYYQNQGTSTAPVFVDITATTTFDSLYCYGYNTLTFGDLDNDGDLDMMLGGDGDFLAYYENIGTAASPNFSMVTTGSPVPVITGYQDEINPELVDIDNDGDLDLFTTEEDYGTVAFYENTGTASAPVFTQVTGSGNPLDLLNGQSAQSSYGIGYHASMKFVDIDGDGDFDLLIGNRYNSDFVFFENTGTAATAAFVHQTSANNPFDGISQEYSDPAFADIDNDGDIDLFFTEYDYYTYGTHVRYFENREVVAGIDELAIDFKIAPNPTTDYVQISLGDNRSLSDYAIKITDVRGADVSTLIRFNGNVLDMSSVAAGVYQISLVGQDKVATRQIIRN